MRPTLKLLEDDLKMKIIAEARDLLCTIGVEVHNREVLGLLGDHGAEIELGREHARFTQELIDKARRWRKVLGGGMRQAGVLAAAGIYALQNHVARLEEDHEKATLLAEGLMEVPQLSVVGGGARTNMVFVEIDPDRSARMKVYLAERDMLVGDAATMRLVTHLDVDPEDIARFVGEVNEFFEHAA